MSIDFTYLSQPPKRYTFEMPKLKEWTEGQCIGKTLNLFAGMTKLNVDEIRVDIDEKAPADYHEDSYSFILNWIGMEGYKFDTIVFDPPYNLHKAREKYGNRYIGSLTKIKNELPRILNVGGRVISYGYDSVGMSKKRGFEKIAICLVCHNGDHNDTIVVVEKFIQQSLCFTNNEPTYEAINSGTVSLTERIK